MKRNIPLLYLYSFLIKRVSLPVTVIYYLSFELDFSDIGVIAAAGAVASILFELPAGIFADRFGKKNSLIAASCFDILTMVLILFGASLTPFVLAAILYGVANALTSGSREALLYDSLAAEGKKTLYKKTYGQMYLFAHILNAIFIGLVPMTYSILPELPFMIALLFFVAALMTATQLSEPQMTREETHVAPSLHAPRMRVVLTTLRRPIIAFPILLFASMTGFLYAQADFMQPILQIAGLNTIYFGIFYSSLRVLQGLMASLVHRVENLFSTGVQLLIHMLLFTSGFLLLGVARGYALLGAIYVVNAGYWMTRVLINDEINKRIDSQNRSTILSVMGLIGQLCTALFVLAFSVSSDAFGIQTSLLWTSLAVILLAGPLLLATIAQTKKGDA
jgi:MFS family permease